MFFFQDINLNENSSDNVGRTFFLFLFFIFCHPDFFSQSLIMKIDLNWFERLSFYLLCAIESRGDFSLNKLFFITHVLLYIYIYNMHINC